MQTTLEFRGALYHGRIEWDDETALVVDLATFTGTLICGRQFGPDDPLTFADATWGESTLEVPALHGKPIRSGTATLVVHGDGAVTGTVALDARYEGTLALTFTGRVAG